jgi:O-acetylserine/cysteine efflux transporter
MRLREILLALFVVVAWGLNFVVIQIGLGTMPPLLLAALRFVVAAIPAIFLPMPKVSLSRFLFIGAFLFTFQFAFLFTGMAAGVPAGLASVVIQSQAFFTGLIAAAVLGERISFRQVAGTLVALGGLGVIALTAGVHDFTMVGMMLCLGAGLSWAIGNVAIRGAGKIDMLAMVCWLSLVPPLPLLALSFYLDGPATVAHALTTMSWTAIGSVLYIGILSTNIGYGFWAYLLRQYPAAQVAPFSLLPIVGTISAALLLGEKFGPVRLLGMVLVVAGLVVAVAPLSLLRFAGGKPKRQRA